MEFAKEFQVTPSGRIAFLDAEVELRTESDVSLYDLEKKVQSDGTVTLTTHRLLFQNEKCKVGFFLDEVTEIQERCPWVGKSKLLLMFTPQKFVMLSIPHFPNFRKSVHEAVDSRKKSLTQAPASRAATTNATLKTNAGIGAVIEMQVVVKHFFVLTNVFEIDNFS